MFAGEGRLTCVISSRRRMSWALTAIVAVPRMAENRLVSIITVMHDNLFSYAFDHSPTSY